jgi:hypothetical protein
MDEARGRNRTRGATLVSHGRSSRSWQKRGTLSQRRRDEEPQERRTRASAQAGELKTAKAARAVHPGSTLKGSRTSGEGSFSDPTRQRAKFVKAVRSRKTSKSALARGTDREGAPEAIGCYAVGRNTSGEDDNPTRGRAHDGVTSCCPPGGGARVSGGENNDASDARAAALTGDGAGLGRARP